MRTIILAAALLLAGCQNAPTPAPATPPAPTVVEVQTPDHSLARCDGKDGSLILGQDLAARVAADKDLAAAMLKACFTGRTSP